MFITNRLPFFLLHFKLKSAYVTHSISISCAYVLQFCFFAISTSCHSNCDTLDRNYMAIAVSDKAHRVLFSIIHRQERRHKCYCISCCFSLGIFGDLIHESNATDFKDVAVVLMWLIYIFIYLLLIYHLARENIEDNFIIVAAIGVS